MINNSIAVYANPGTLEISTNYNIWTDFGLSNFLDISLNVFNAPSRFSVTVFLPFTVSKNELTDLGPFYKNESIATGIYDCPITVQEFKNENYIVLLTNQEGPTAFIQLSDSDYSIEALDNSSTLIKFVIPTPVNYQKVTFTFRIPFKSLTSQIHHILANKRNWLDVIATPVMQRTLPFDYRVNEVRSLPSVIAREAKDTLFKEQRFFINVPNDIEVDRLNCVKVRSIETDIFKEYFPSKCYKNGGLCYMWKKNTASSSVLSTILVYKKWSVQSICFYLSIISLINIICGILVNHLFS